MTFAFRLLKSEDMDETIRVVIPRWACYVVMYGGTVFVGLCVLFNWWYGRWYYRNHTPAGVTHPCSDQPLTRLDP